MTAPDFLSSTGFAALVDEISTADPASSLRLLYGDEYRESFADRSNYGMTSTLGGKAPAPAFKFRALGYPKPVRLAAFLAPLADGLIANDGSPPNRNTRVPGWWARSGDDWRPTSLVAICVSLSAAADSLARAALERAEAAKTARAADAADAARLAAALASLAALVAGGPRVFSDTASILAERLALPPTVQDSILREWFMATADTDDWRPGLRVDTAIVWDAYKRDGGPYLRHDLLRRLDRVIGPRARRGYRVPVEDAA